MKTVFCVLSFSFTSIESHLFMRQSTTGEWPLSSISIQFQFQKFCWIEGCQLFVVTASFCRTADGVGEQHHHEAIYLEGK